MSVVRTMIARMNDSAGESVLDERNRVGDTGSGGEPEEVTGEQPIVAQVWAVDTRDGHYVFLADGDGDRWKPGARAGHLACPVPDCEAPLFQAVAGTSGRRHHFRHQVKQLHAPETIDHIQSKAMLAEWARRQVPDAEVREEMTLKDLLPFDRYVHRRADVGVRWSDGARVAIEVEYKVADVAAWSRKQDDYVTLGVTATWLFGDTSRHLVARPNGTVRVGDVARAGGAAVGVVLNVNPYDQTVGTAVVTGDQGAMPDSIGIGRLAAGGDRFARVIVCPLDDCRLDPQRGLVTPTMDQVWAADEERRRIAEQTRFEAEARSARDESTPLRGTVRERVIARWLCTDPPPDPEYQKRVTEQRRPIATYRTMVGLPSSEAPRDYVPWWNSDGFMIAEPPLWWPGGVPLRHQRRQPTRRAPDLPHTDG